MWKGLRNLLRSLSTGSEFTIVALGAFGIAIIRSLSEVVHPRGQPLITETHLKFLLIEESLTLALLLSFLFARGWTFRRLGLWPGVKDTFIGFGLALLAYFTYVLIFILLAFFWPDAGNAARNMDFVKPGFSAGTIVAVSLINPLFEEIFVCGYVVSTLQERGRFWDAINISVGLRLLYHLYQGIPGIIGIIPFGSICAYWFASRRRLWPAIVAHALLDCFSLMGYSTR